MASWTDALSGLFKGTPQAAPSYTTTTSDVPKWLQDYTVDLFSQQRAVSSLPFQQYQLPRIAQEQGATTRAYDLIQDRIGTWQDPTNTALRGMQALGGQTAGQGAALNMLGSAAGMNAYNAAQPYIGTSAGTLQSATGQNAMSAASPYLQSAGTTDITGAASPYLQTASQNAYQNVGNYMNPYNQAVTDQIARLGARNLSENLLPGVSDQFVRAGQFGSSRMGEFGGRALRDTQEAVLNQQAQALQQGYGQALSAAQTDAARQAQLASTAGGLSAQEAQNLLSVGQQYGNLTQAQQQALLQAANQYGALGQQQGALTGQTQQNLANIGTQYGQLAASEAARQQSALGQVADISKLQQGLATADAAALQSVGAERQALQQRGLDTAYQDFLTQQQWPQQQINAMSATLRGLPPAAVPSVGTQVGATTQFTQSPLSQVAQAYNLAQGISRLGN